MTTAENLNPNPMREIKFRAWNGKHMIDASYGDWVSFDGIAWTQASIGYDTPNTEIEKAKDYILMQFTGLLDKNGKEIYEGDIITDTANKINSREWNAEVVWSDIGFSLSECHPTERSLWELAERGRLEVIGNIYENPEPI